MPEADEVFAAAQLAKSSIEQFIHNTHSEWFQTIDQSVARELHANLLTVDRPSGGCVLAGCVAVVTDGSC